MLEAIARADIITTSVGPNILPRVAPVIADGLLQRASTNPTGNGVTIVACENMLRGSTQLKTHVERALQEKSISPTAIDSSQVGFADCAVDRIVPPFEGADLLDVGVEGFYEWVVEDCDIKGEVKAKGIKGMQCVSKLQPFLERKLYTLNCGHAILAYIGYHKGLTTMLDAVSDNFAHQVVRAALEESGAGLVRRHSEFFSEEGHKQYIERTMIRYANPNLRDILTRVGRTPIRKLSPGERLMGAVQMCKENQVSTDNLLIGMAAAFFFDVKEDEESQQLLTMLKKEGIEKAIQQTTGLGPSSKESKAIIKAYHDFGGRKSSVVDHPYHEMSRL